MLHVSWQLSSAVMTRAESWPDWIIRIQIGAKNVLYIAAWLHGNDGLGNGYVGHWYWLKIIY